MKFLKKYKIFETYKIFEAKEGYQKKLLNDIEDILLELKDDGFEVCVQNSNIAFYIDDEIETRNFKYSKVKDVINRLIDFLGDRLIYIEMIDSEIHTIKIRNNKLTFKLRLKMIENKKDILHVKIKFDDMPESIKDFLKHF